MDFIGTSGRDNYVGTVDPDEFDMSQGGRDTVSGLDGDDVFIFGSELNANDQIDGGADFDTLILDGNYLAGVVFTPTTLVNVEEIVLEAGFQLLPRPSTTRPTRASSRSTRRPWAPATPWCSTARPRPPATSTSSAAPATTFSPSTTAATSISASAAPTSPPPAARAPTTSHMDADFDAGDSLVGGGGEVDGLHLGGDYSAGLTITGSMLSETEIILISGFWSGSFVVEDAVVGAGMTVLRR